MTKVITIRPLLQVDAADVDIQVDLLAEPLVAEVAGEGPLLVVHQTLVLVQHRLYREETCFSYQLLYRIDLFIR